MKAPKTLLLIGAIFALAATQPVFGAPAPNAKLWSGTWQLNTEKSKFSAPTSSEVSETRDYVVSGKRVTMHSRFVGRGGRAVKWSYSAAWDGKSYPAVGNQNADHIILTPVSDREVKSRTTLHGKTSAATTASVSADGKQLTMMRSILTAKGGPTKDTLVYDRVK